MNYEFTTLDQKLAAAREWLAREYRGVRTGRAAPAILDGLSVTAYGSMVPLKQIAAVSVEDARTLRIAPFDPSLIKEIERSLTAGNLGLGISADGSSVRASFPELTSERRLELVKIAKHKLEEARAAVRVARDETKKDVQEAEKEGGMGEDEKFRIVEELQKRVDAANAELEKAFENKEREMSL
ncbi:MAG TPA: ribosome recycling factor [Candidatus Paceibacterota bacterium]|nr:ribosome recycling factor [Candidatus Paceibacterota bacterium]